MGWLGSDPRVTRCVSTVHGLVADKDDRTDSPWQQGKIQRVSNQTSSSSTLKSRDCPMGVHGRRRLRIMPARAISLAQGDRVQGRFRDDGVGESSEARKAKQANPKIRQCSLTQPRADAASQNAKDHLNAFAERRLAARPELSSTLRRVSFCHPNTYEKPSTTAGMESIIHPEEVVGSNPTGASFPLERRSSVR